jgi:hypothetical protein
MTYAFLNPRTSVVSVVVVLIISVLLCAGG